MKNAGRRIDHGTVRFERLLPGPIERVWSFLVEEEKRREWLAAGRTELSPGGVAEFKFDNMTLTTPDDRPPAKYRDCEGPVEFSGRVLEVDPPRRLVFTWPERSGGDTVVTFELAPKGDRVQFVVTHARILEQSDLVSASGGWHAHLDVLEARLSGAAIPPFWATHTRCEEEYVRRFAEAEAGR